MATKEKKEFPIKYKSPYEYTEENFPNEIFRSIAYQIYQYLFSNSQIFFYFMLPILPNLLEILRFYSFVRNK